VDKNQVFEAVSCLVREHNTDDGVSEEVHNATLDLLAAIYGPTLASAFNHLVEATDGQFYVSGDTSLQDTEDFLAELARHV